MIFYIDLNEYNHNNDDFLFVPVCIDLKVNPDDMLNDTLNFSQYRNGRGFCRMPTYSKITMIVSVAFRGYEYYKEMPMSVEFTDYGDYKVMWREFINLHASLHLGEKQLLKFFKESTTGVMTFFSIYKDLRKVILHQTKTKYLKGIDLVAERVNIHGDVFKIIETKVPEHVLIGKRNVSKSTQL